MSLPGKKVYGLDSKQDGVINAFALDTNNDGIINVIGYDDSGDGTIDTYDDAAYDFRMFNLMLTSKKAHEGGDTESLGLDLNGDGKIDAYMVDTTGDGRFDSVGFDTSGDGKVDAFDTTGDGLPDVRKGSMADIMRKNRPVAVSMQQRKIALIDLFHAIDKGGDGTIEGSEMEDFLSAIFPESENKAMQDKQIRLMIEQLDVDGDGEVDLIEFLGMMEPVVQTAEHTETPEQVAHRMFKMLDADGGGEVSTTEFRDMLHKVGMDMSYDEVRGLFAEYDESCDGCIDKEEFEAMMAHQL